MLLLDVDFVVAGFGVAAGGDREESWAVLRLIGHGARLGMEMLSEEWDAVAVYMSDFCLIICRAIFSRPLRDRQWRRMGLQIIRAGSVGSQIDFGRYNWH